MLVGECKAGTVHVFQLSVLPVILFPTVRLIVSAPEDLSDWLYRVT